ncbi:hypothetical protein DOY81_014545 [Sarcophaga bullata]|nr:hypothetical protein DOY81_014545 [Sarcophaga bullata]
MPLQNLLKGQGTIDLRGELANSTKGIVELILEIQDCREPIDPTHHENGSVANIDASTSSLSSNREGGKSTQSWNRMTSEVKRKMGISNVNTKSSSDFALKITTARMRCSNKAKDELEATAGSVYVKTTVFEHGIYIDSWKSVPLQSIDNLDHILIRTTLATKTKMGKKLVLGTVVVCGPAAGTALSETAAEHMASLRESALNERVAMWHCYQ